MKITVDENIAYGKDAFSQFGDVELLHGRKITPGSVKDSDALIVRSITKVDKNLLEGSKVKFVGTATIGKDHIDRLGRQVVEGGNAIALDDRVQPGGI